MGLNFPSLLYENRQNYAGEKDYEDFAAIRDATSTLGPPIKCFLSMTNFQPFPDHVLFCGSEREKFS